MLTEIIAELKQQLQTILLDLDKSLIGNKSAAQRVRTMTIELSKTAKRYRKESLLSEKKRID